MLALSRTAWFILSLSLGLSLVLALTFAFFKITHREKMESVQPNFILFKEPRKLHAFQLSAGKQTVFSNQLLQGHWTLLFFGFTHCSAVCPASLQFLNQVYQNLHAFAPTLQVVFISIDPQVDSQAATQAYVQRFNSAFLGFSGKSEELQQLKAQFAIYAEAEGAVSSQINHSSSLQLINPQGEWVAVFPFGLPRAEMQADLQKLLSHSP